MSLDVICLGNKQSMFRFVIMKYSDIIFLIVNSAGFVITYLSYSKSSTIMDELILMFRKVFTGFISRKLLVNF